MHLPYTINHYLPESVYIYVYMCYPFVCLFTFLPFYLDGCNPMEFIEKKKSGFIMKSLGNEGSIKEKT